MTELDQFKQTYITECFELLEEMEEKLLELNADDVDLDEINAIFRCAHSIKGGGGAFGFSRLVNFTHILEALLDAMREDRLLPTEEVVDALLQSVDIVSQLVVAAQDGRELGDDFGAELQEQLKQIVAGAEGGKPVEALPDHTPVKREKVTEHFQITFIPQRTLFESGNEPLLIIRELQRVGQVRVEVNTDGIVDIEEHDPEECYLKWLLQVTTDQGREAIEEAFEFVEDECILDISLGEAPAAAEDDSMEDEFGGLFLDAPGAQASDAPADDSMEDEFGGLFLDAPGMDGAPAEEAQTPPAAAVSSAPAKGVSKPAREDKKAEAAKKGPAVSSMRVDIDKVDQLVNMVGELVITQAMIVNNVKELPPDKFVKLLSGVEELTFHTRNLQEAVMAVRMQPVKSIFARMPRIVRDISRALKKKIRIEMVGESTEIDKTVIEQLGDPLTHMIRNSVDHGIEKPADRLAKGKPEEGVIRLSADNSGGRIIIEISDDGNGINREKVHNLAIEKGLVDPNVELTPEEVDNLIFMPGFSTADEVTDVSGRGVGMDVVKRNIEDLGGMIDLQNRPGQGSTISVSLPLTLAILDGMIVRIGTEDYIIPINNIIESLRPAVDEIKQVRGGADVLNVRGDYLPILYLYKIFNTTNANTDMKKALVVLVESGREKFGLVVDEIIGQQQVVIKSIEENSEPVDGVSGATILGNGKVSLILDVAKLQQMTTHDKFRAGAITNEAA